MENKDIEAYRVYLLTMYDIFRIGKYPCTFSTMISTDRGTIVVLCSLNHILALTGPQVFSIVQSEERNPIFMWYLSLDTDNNNKIYVHLTSYGRVIYPNTPAEMCRLFEKLPSNVQGALCETAIKVYKEIEKNVNMTTCVI